jgi:hypothetical protein
MKRIIDNNSLKFKKLNLKFFLKHIILYIQYIDIHIKRQIKLNFRFMIFL